MLLLLGTILMIFSLTFNMVKGNMISSIGDHHCPQNFHYIALRPITIFKLSFKNNKLWFTLFSLGILCLFGIFSFLFLSKLFSIQFALIGFIPLTFIILYTFYYGLWFGSILICTIINVGNAKFNIIFSLVMMVLILTWLGSPTDNFSVLSFSLAFFNLFLCYLFTATALKIILSDILSATFTFNHQNLWKVALMVIAEFLITLTLFCYIGYLYFPQSYSQNPLTLFDFFYYVVITFGTIGYGDIAPTCFYSKLIAILIVFTSITCISIMLSSFLSVSSSNSKK